MCLIENSLEESFGDVPVEQALAVLGGDGASSSSDALKLLLHNTWRDRFALQRLDDAEKISSGTLKHLGR